MISTSFGATTTAAEVIAGVDLRGRRMIVTGASSGIGVETARALACAGAEITLAVRDVEAGKRVAADIDASIDVGGADSGDAQSGGAGLAGSTRVVRLDLADQQSVTEFVAGWDGPLHALVANAGVMAIPTLQRTREGWEMQFATNHLGHFALATGLHDALAAAGDARLVVVSSVGHINGGIDFDDIMFERRPYDPWVAYSQSKTANILFAVEAARRWAADGITANALNPGRIRETGLGRHSAAGPAAPTSFAANDDKSGVSVKNVAQGAATSVLLAGSPLVKDATGRYFEDAQEAEPHRPGVRRGFAAHALDPADAAKLWAVSVAYTTR